MYNSGILNEAFSLQRFHFLLCGLCGKIVFMSKRIIIAGGSGFVGQVLSNSLSAVGYDVEILTRGPDAPGRIHWDGKPDSPWVQAISGTQAVINLVGENVAEGAWTLEKKRRIRDSRVGSVKAIVEAIDAAVEPPAVLMQASATGIYGDTADVEIDEACPYGSGFLADVCKEWEMQAHYVTEYGVRLCLLRLGLVLGPDGGVLQKVLPPFKMGVGGHLGNGKQWMSWIHLADIVGAIRHLLENDKLDGAFNLTAPQPLQGKEFFTTLAKILKRPCFMHVPEFALKTAFGQMAREMLLSSQRVLPQRLLKSGYVFQYNELERALSDLVG